MYFVTKARVIAQPGEPEYYFLPEDLKLLTKDAVIRGKILEFLGKDSILCASTEETLQVNVDLSDVLKAIGGGYHSKL